MVKKAFRWLLIFLAGLLVLLLLAAAGFYWYVDSRRDLAAREAAEQLGLDLQYKNVTFTYWDTWPEVSLRVDSLTLRDRHRPTAEDPLLTADHLDALFNLDRIWDDTLKFEVLRINGGSFNLLTDSTGRFNLGALAGARDTTKSEGSDSGTSLFAPVVDWEDAQVFLTDFGTNYVDTIKNKRMTNRFDSLLVVASTLADGDLQFNATLDTHVGGLAFNTEKGAYLRDTDLSGLLKITRRDTAWHIDTTVLRAGPDEYRLAGTVGRGDHAGIRLYIANPRTVYDRARALLHDTLTAKLDAYAVEGPFPVIANVISRPEDGKNVEVQLHFKTYGQNVRLQKYRFTNVTTEGTFVNRLPKDEGGTGHRTDFRIETEPTVAYYDGMKIETPQAIVRGVKNEPFLDAPLLLTGGAGALSRLFGNTNFFFRRGRFAMETHVDASLMSIPDIVTSTDGTLKMDDLVVDYQAAGVRFDFASIFVRKAGEDVQFNLKSGDFPTDLDFNLAGRLDNILPLLLDRPGEELTTEVVFSADTLNWSGFRELFGRESFANAGGKQKSGAESDAQVQSMKRTLLGLQNSFHPQLTVQIGQLGYYDVMKLKDFTSGLHFDGDTMVLEHTSFSWRDSDLAFDARFNMGTFNRTPFAVAVAADHLDLQALRQPLTAFGLKIPRGIDELPTDLKIRFSHEGVINDTFGIQPGTNYGMLTFNDGRENLFGGTVSYGPRDGVLQTHIDLSGDPSLVNDLFDAEDFFFSSGHFRIDLDVSDVPETVGDLIETAKLSLRIDSSNLRYEPAGAYVPIRSFRVTASDNHATVDLRLTSDATRRSVALTGEMEGLSAFLYPENDETFKVKADATAGRLHASDIRTFINFDERQATNSTTTDSTGAADFNPQQIVSAGEGIFNSFRPDLSLRIDTFDLDKSTQFRDLHAGIRIQDSTVLVLEKTGFEMNAGRVELSGTYDIDRRMKSPFTLLWRTDSVQLDQIMLTARELGLPGIDSMGSLRGILATRGDVDGRIDEKRKRLLMNRSEAGVRLKTSTIVLDDWPQLQAMGRKALMKKRFNTIHLAPLDVNLRIDSGTVHIPHTEIQSSALQLFVEGRIDTVRGPDLLLSVPVFANLFRGAPGRAPAKTGLANAGWKVYLVMEQDKEGVTKTRFRLGRRKFYKDRGRLAELRALKVEEKRVRRVRK